MAFVFRKRSCARGGSPTSEPLAAPGSSLESLDSFGTFSSLGSLGDSEHSPTYPDIDDPAFNAKISRKQEFLDAEMRPISHETNPGGMETVADKLCNRPFEIAPHQHFIKNFVSFYTPYRSMLLFHGLGSGKTCTAIHVCETMRHYYRAMNIKKKVMIIASPNVVGEFERQLFDSRQLKRVDGVWTMNSCVGRQLLREVNPTEARDIEAAVIEKKIQSIIRNNYEFIGYTKFKNFIERHANVEISSYSKRDTSASEREKIRKRLSRLFENQLIVIDEAHNLRDVKSDNANKQVIVALQLLLESVQHMKILLLSATPLYNAAFEVVTLLNILRKNDGRYRLKTSEIFDRTGEFVLGEDGEEVGKARLKAALTGYVSYVKGENPYTFPFRIYPAEYSPERSILSRRVVNYEFDVYGRPIEEGVLIKYTDVYMSPLSRMQSYCYLDALEALRSEEAEGDENDNADDTSETSAEYNFMRLRRLLYALLVVYPVSSSTDTDSTREATGGARRRATEQQTARGEQRYTVDQAYLIARNESYTLGSDGLDAVCPHHTDSVKRRKYAYAPGYERFFRSDSLREHAGKIYDMIERIRASRGIVLVYSEYLASGVIPIALALEEAGMVRFDKSDSLFESPPSEPAHYVGLVAHSDYKAQKNAKGKGKAQKGEADHSDFRQARYALITGDEKLSHNRKKEIRALSDANNVDGALIKVVVISRAGGEGIDFKNIRQVHVMDPWYNLNRIEQVIGRGVRYCSHMGLPFRERNVEIYNYGSVLCEDASRPIPQVPADVHIYGMAERKAVQIAKVTRVIKESAVDCVINRAQQLYSDATMNTEVEIATSSGVTIAYRVGDKKNTLICDYMDDCAYSCDADANADADAATPDMGTYMIEHTEINIDGIVDKVREIFQTGFEFHRNEIKKRIDAKRFYPDMHIEAALERVVNDPNTHMYDRYSRLGHVVRIGEYYMFQPIEMTQFLTREEREIPINFKRADFVPLEHVRLMRTGKSSSSSSSRTTSTSSQGSSSLRKTSWKTLTSKSNRADVRIFLRSCYNMCRIGMASTGEESHKIFAGYRSIPTLSSTSMYNIQWYRHFYEIFTDDPVIEMTIAEKRALLTRRMCDQFDFGTLLLVLDYMECGRDADAETVEYDNGGGAEFATYIDEFHTMLSERRFAVRDFSGKSRPSLFVIDEANMKPRIAQLTESSEKRVRGKPMSDWVGCPLRWSITEGWNKEDVMVEKGRIETEIASGTSNMYGFVDFARSRSGSKRTYPIFKIKGAVITNGNAKGFKIEDKTKRDQKKIVLTLVGNDKDRLNSLLKNPRKYDGLKGIELSVFVEAMIQLFDMRRHEGLRWCLSPVEFTIDKLHLLI